MNGLNSRQYISHSNATHHCNVVWWRFSFMIGLDSQRLGRKWACIAQLWLPPHRQHPSMLASTPTESSVGQKSCHVGTGLAHVGTRLAHVGTGLARVLRATTTVGPSVQLLHCEATGERRPC